MSVGGSSVENMYCAMWKQKCCGSRMTYFESDPQQKSKKKLDMFLKVYLHNRAAARFLKQCNCKWLNI
jgi:hypothetical protein